MRFPIVAAVFAVMLLGFSMAPAFGAVTLSNSTCSSTTVSELNVTIGTVTSSGQNVTTTTQSSYCSFGCNYKTGMCSEPLDATGYMLASAFIAFIFAYIGSNMTNKQHMPIQVAFIFFSIILMIVSAGLMREMGGALGAPSATVNLMDTLIIVVTFAFYFAIAYWLVMFVWQIINWLGSAASNKKENPKGG